MKRQQGGPEGILLIDKPAGWTSHDVVAKVRGLAGQRRIGHTGTLDPAATGLLVLCLGRATRLVEYMGGHTKAYTGEIQLGATTDTDDAEGTVLERRPVGEVTDADLEELRQRFSGAIAQVPPAYSAIKVGGQKAYDAARRGQRLDLKPRQVVISGLRLRSLGDGRLSVDVECSAGTYIRGLARDIGEALGCGAHLAALRRLRAGHFRIEDALTLDELAAIVSQHPVDAVLLPPDEGMLHFDAALLSRAEPMQVRLLRGLAGAGSETVRLYDGDGAFLGTAVVGSDGSLRPAKVFVAPPAAGRGAAESSQMGSESAPGAHKAGNSWETI